MPEDCVLEKKHKLLAKDIVKHQDGKWPGTKHCVVKV